MTCGIKGCEANAVKTAPVMGVMKPVCGTHAKAFSKPFSKPTTGA